MELAEDEHMARHTPHTACYMPRYTHTAKGSKDVRMYLGYTPGAVMFVVAGPILSRLMAPRFAYPTQTFTDRFCSMCSTYSQR